MYEIHEHVQQLANVCLCVSAVQQMLICLYVLQQVFLCVHAIKGVCVWMCLCSLNGLYLCLCEWGLLYVCACVFVCFHSTLRGFMNGWELLQWSGLTQRPSAITPVLHAKNSHHNYTQLGKCMFLWRGPWPIIPDSRLAAFIKDNCWWPKMTLSLSMSFQGQHVCIKASYFMCAI